MDAAEFSCRAPAVARGMLSLARGGLKSRQINARLSGPSRNRKSRPGMCADEAECDRLNGNLQSLLAAFRPPKTGQ